MLLSHRADFPGYDGVRKIILRDGLGKQAAVFENAGEQRLQPVPAAACGNRAQLDKVRQLNGRSQLQNQSLVIVAVRMRSVARQRAQMLIDQRQLERDRAGIALIGEQ